MKLIRFNKGIFINTDGTSTGYAEYAWYTGYRQNHNRIGFGIHSNIGSTKTTINMIFNA
jgi:hypothetical protein